MRSGYVLDFTNATFAEFFREYGIDIYAEKYAIYGDSKAKRLRGFWDVEPDDLVADVLEGLLDYWRALRPDASPDERDLAEKAQQIIKRLRFANPLARELSNMAGKFSWRYLEKQIQRMENSLEDDPELVIGTAKEVVETCCRTILMERGVAIPASPDIPKLVKLTLNELPIFPESLSRSSQGRDTVKRVLGSLSGTVHGLAELRNLYGTGHGKEARARFLDPHHARLAMGAAVTIATFLFDVHLRTRAP